MDGPQALLCGFELLPCYGEGALLQRLLTCPEMAERLNQQMGFPALTRKSVDTIHLGNDAEEKSVPTPASQGFCDLMCSL